MNKESLAVLKDWEKQISSFEKLKFKEAQELYKKAVSTTDTELKKIYIDKLVLGTLYVIYDYIKRNDLELFCSSTYDMNDIINSFNEIWIKKINAGELLNVDKFSLLFTSNFFKEVCSNLVGEKILVNEQFGINTECFIGLFTKFIELKNKGIEFSYKKMFDDYYQDRYYPYLSLEYRYGIIGLFEKIYENLNYDKVNDLYIGKTKIYNYLRLIINAGLIECLSDKLVDKTNMEDKKITEMFFESFINDVDSVLNEERRRELIHQRFGLDNNEPNTLEDMAKKYKVTQQRVRQIEAQTLRKLRINKKIRSYM